MVDEACSPTRGWKKVLLRRALRRRCPQCGVGALFLRYARLAQSCSACGLVFRREPGAQTGSMYLTAAVTEVFTAGVIAFLWLATDLSTAAGLALGVPVVLAFCYGFLPWSMALWTAIDYGTDLHNGEDWARPRA